MPRYSALVLAAGRGPDDAMARAYGVSHKCLVPVAGTPMLRRVIETLLATADVGEIAVLIERQDVAEAAFAGVLPDRVTAIRSEASASASVLAACRSPDRTWPILVTTGDHPLLAPAMVEHFLARSAASGADLTCGLARAETILAAYPDTRRTFLRLGPDAVSGCNLYALNTQRALAAVALWQRIEQDRKRPWRMIRAFGLRALAGYLLGSLTLARAFAEASRRLAISAEPVLLPFAEAAIDVDKPADKELAERILARRPA